MKARARSPEAATHLSFRPAEWRCQLSDEGDSEFLDPTRAQEIAPRLMDEVQVLQAKLALSRADALREAADALSSRLADLSTFGGACTCRNGEAKAFLNRLREMVEAEASRLGSRSAKHRASAAATLPASGTLPDWREHPGIHLFRFHRC